MGEKKTTPKKRLKRYQIELTSLSIFLWSFGLLFLLSWIFVLGILVGRGFFPDSVTALSDLKGQISKLQEMISRNKSTDSGHNKKPDPEPKLAFYEKLSSKKEEAVKGPITESKKGTGSTNSNRKQDVPIPAGQYTVQIASLREREKAEKMVDRLMDRGYPAYFYEVKINGKVYYRIRCRKFINREEAQHYADKLAKEEGIKGYVTRIE